MTQPKQAAQGWGTERCLWRWLKRNFPISGFWGGAELALGGAKRRLSRRKHPEPTPRRINSWGRVIKSSKPEAKMEMPAYIEWELLWKNRRHR
jgi:hypothetical protein